MPQELELPLPEALRHTAETAPEPLHAQYTALADGITDSDRPFCEQWAAAIRALDMLTPDARAALLTLGAQLGKYDAQLQRQALDTCIASLQSISAALQDDARRRGKLVCGLGATLGLLAAVALLCTGEGCRDPASVLGTEIAFQQTADHGLVFNNHHSHVLLPPVPAD